MISIPFSTFAALILLLVGVFSLALYLYAYSRYLEGSDRDLYVEDSRGEDMVPPEALRGTPRRSNAKAGGRS